MLFGIKMLGQLTICSGVDASITDRVAFAFLFHFSATRASD